MQRVQNYGSFLQAYGLKKTLEGLGNEVVFIAFMDIVDSIVKETNQQQITKFFLLRKDSINS